MYKGENLEVYYENSQGKKIYFGQYTNFLNESDIRDYQWEYKSQYNKVKSFQKSLTTRTLPVIVYHRGGWEYRNDLWENSEEIYELLERDVMTLKPGKLYIGNYYVVAYIIGSAKSDYTNGKIIKLNLSVLSDFKWRKEVVKVFGGESDYEPGTYDVDYPYDYRWDYSPGNNVNIFTSGAVAPFDFEIVIQPVKRTISNPRVVVGGYLYSVYAYVSPGEYLTINSIDKTIIRTKSNGETVNEFSKRNREYYIFEKMPVESGSIRVEYMTGVLTTIKAFVERSEPEWI